VSKPRSLCHGGYQEIPEGNDEQNANNEIQTPNKYITGLMTIPEMLGLLVQIGVVVAAIPALSTGEKAIETITVIIMPILLIIISFVWSGWIQLKMSKSYIQTQPGSARLKAGT